MTNVHDRLEWLSESSEPSRSSRVVNGPRGPRAVVEGRPCTLVCSDNYLGIADHPRVREAASDAALRWGGGTGSPRPASGEMSAHRHLERSIAEFVGFEAVLVQGPAQLSVAATVAALARPDGVVFADEMCHPGIISGCELSGAEIFFYDHGDVGHLEWGLRRAADRASLIVTEGVFGAEGDLAPVEELSELAAEHECPLLVEESHAVGSVGPEGRGLVASRDLAGEAELVVVASLGKALGSYGSFVACGAEMSSYLERASAAIRFSSSLPPAATAAAGAALEVLRDDPYRVERLRLNGECLRAALAGRGVATGPSGSQIVSVPAGGREAMADAFEGALRHGVLIGTAEPPLMPDGEHALRLTAIATHRPAELELAVDVIARACRDAGVAAAEPLRPLEPGPDRSIRWREGRISEDLEVPDWIGEPAAADVPDWIRAA